MFIKILGNLNRVTSDYSRSVGFTPATGLYYTSPANSVFFWQVVSPEHHLYLGCLEKSRAQHGSFWFKLLALRFGSLKGTMKLWRNRKRVGDRLPLLSVPVFLLL